MAKPIFRIFATPKDCSTKEERKSRKVEIGVVWPGKFDGSDDVKYHEESKDNGEWSDHMSEADFQKAGGADAHWISLVSTAPKQERNPYHASTPEEDAPF